MRLKLGHSILQRQLVLVNAIFLLAQLSSHEDRVSYALCPETLGP